MPQGEAQLRRKQSGTPSPPLLSVTVMRLSTRGVKPRSAWSSATHRHIVRGERLGPSWMRESVPGVGGEACLEAQEAGAALRPGPSGAHLRPFR